MRKKLTISCLLLFSLIVSSCATHVSVLTNIRTARKSFVKVETWVGVCDIKDGTCYKPEIYSVGSGSVVFYGNTKKVLTAAHVCDIGSIAKKITKAGGKVFIKVVDRDGKSHIAELFRINNKVDICLLKTPTLKVPALRISVKKPEYAEKVYNIAAPMGISDGDMVPVFEGLFFGNKGDRAYYNIPAIGGSSGSPILNVRGELVGMLHSVHFRFHHISLSATHADLWNFLDSSRSHASIIQKLCLRSGCGLSHAEEFLQEYDTF